MTIQTPPPDTADQAAPLDALLADAALGTFRRFAPDARRERGSDGTFGPRADGFAFSSWTVPTT
jgi:hypothetical protein